MVSHVISSKEGRARWRDLLDLAHKGQADTVIERNGRPVAALIPFEDYEAILDELDDIRAARRAEAILEEIERDPSLVQDYDDARAELIASGALDE